MESIDHTWRVVRNDEHQYSIWPQYKELPAGWDDTGTTGSKELCLEHIAEVWQDMRPRSLVEQLAAMPGDDGPVGDQDRSGVDGLS